MSEEEQPIISSDEEASFLSHFFVIPEGLDFTNTVLIVLFMGSIIIELLYLCSPQLLKRKIEGIDFDAKTHKFSYTGCLCFMLVLLLILT